MNSNNGEGADYVCLRRCLLQVHKALQLWKSLQIPDLLAKLSSLTRAPRHVHSVNLNVQPTTVNAQSLGVLALQRLVAGKLNSSIAGL